VALSRYEIVVYRRESSALTVDALAERAGVHTAIIEKFVESGLLEPVERRGRTFLFDASAVIRLRTICRLRESLGINLAGVAVVLDLLDKLNTLQRENELLRSRL
jgi:MerR family transcriptional regulator, heat shock protein HspR